MKKYLEYPVFICGHRKTGTTMLVNLFDGAKDAVVFPDDSTFFYMYFPRYVGERFSVEEKRERLANVLVGEVHRKKIAKANCTEAEREKLMGQLEDFRAEILTWPAEDFELKQVLPKFIDGYNRYFQRVEHPKVWIEKTTSTEIYALELLDNFPNAKFIHIIRDPRDNWGSLLSGWEQRYKEYNDEVNRLKQSLIERSGLGFQMAMANEDVMGKDRYRIVRFEDVTADPQRYIRELAEFIGIDYSTDLLYPSTFGYRWEGNNFDGEKFSKPSTVNVNRWRDRISEADAQLIEFHFREAMDHFGYDRVFDRADCIRAAAAHYKWFNFSTPFSAK
ncbi:MAG: sulfotransferase [Saprospiraceae bacterium]|nr:sulfotransferase [Lewinella sp.]